MKSFDVAATGILIVCAALSGCRPINLGANYGASYQAGIREQVRNPDRVDNVDRGDTIDGSAAENAVQAYRKTFEPKSNVGPPIAPSMVRSQ